MSRLVIIGGGISGLASAALLAREGHEVTLLEAHVHVGGRVGSWSRAGFRFDTGPSWYLMPDVFDHFFRLLGTSAAEQLNLVTLDPGYRVFFEGEARHLDVSSSREENIELFERVRRGAGRRLARYLKSGAKTYESDKRRVLYASLATRRQLPVRDVIGDRVRTALSYPAAVVGASSYLTPSFYRLMSQLDSGQGVRYPLGGFMRVIRSIEELAKAEGATIRTHATVTKITVEHGKATGVEYVGSDRRKHALPADIVVSAADLHHTETALLDADRQTYPQEYWDASTPAPSALVIYLGVKGELPQLQHHTVFLAKDWKRGFDDLFGAQPTVPTPPSLYVCKPSALDSDVAPDGHENLVVVVPLPADEGFGKGGIGRKGGKAIERLADTVIEQIGRWAGIPNLAGRIVLRRTVGPTDFARDLNAWRGTALGPVHTRQQSASPRARSKSERVDGLFYVGAAGAPGAGLPMCLISAEVLLKSLRGDASPEPLSEPPPRPR